MFPVLNVWQQTVRGLKGMARNHIKGVQESLFASFRQSWKIVVPNLFDPDQTAALISLMDRGGGQPWGVTGAKV